MNLAAVTNQLCLVEASRVLCALVFFPEVDGASITFNIASAIVEAQLVLSLTLKFTAVACELNLQRPCGSLFLEASLPHVLAFEWSISVDGTLGSGHLLILLWDEIIIFFLGLFLRDAALEAGAACVAATAAAADANENN